jgi:hypothetical protein
MITKSFLSHVKHACMAHYIAEEDEDGTTNVNEKSGHMIHHHSC